MRLETRKRNIEKSDLDSLVENRWNNPNSQTSYSRSDEIQSIKDLLDSLEDPLFSEQEAGKATIYTELSEKEDERIFEEISSEEMLKKIDDLFK